MILDPGTLSLKASLQTFRIMNPMLTSQLSNGDSCILIPVFSFPIPTLQVPSALSVCAHLATKVVAVFREIVCTAETVRNTKGGGGEGVTKTHTCHRHHLCRCCSGVGAHRNLQWRHHQSQPVQREAIPRGERRCCVQGSAGHGGQWPLCERGLDGPLLRWRHLCQCEYQ